MALSSAAMATLVKTKIAAAVAANPGGLSSIDPVIDAICEGVVEHFKASAEVLPGDPPPVGLAVAVMGTPTPVTGKGKVG